MSKALLIHPEELSNKWIDRAASLGVDTLAIHPWGGKAAPKTLEELVSKLKEPSYRSLIDRAIDEKGLKIEYEFHAAGYLLPRELFKTNPEYFRVNKDGIRTDDYNFCISNKEAVKIISKRAAELVTQLYRSTDDYYFWLDDSKDAFCHCDKCKHISPANQQMMIMNSVIDEIRKVNPKARLSYLAYCETETPPPDIEPNDGIFLEYAPFLRDFSKPVSDSPRESLDAIPLLFERFDKKDAKLLEYWFDNSLFSNWKKPPKKFTPDNDMIVGDIKYYKSIGFENIRVFACFLGSDYEELFGDPDLSAFK